MPRPIIRIGFLSPSNPEDKRASSSTFHAMARVLKEMGHAVIWLPVKDTDFTCKLYLRIVKKIKRIFPKLGNLIPTLPEWKAKIISRKLDYRIIDGCDVIFAPMESLAVSVINSKKPIIYLSDATYPLMWDYYWFHVPRLLNPGPSTDEPLPVLGHHNIIPNCIIQNGYLSWMSS